MNHRPHPVPTVHAGQPGYLTVGTGAVHVRDYGPVDATPLVLLHDTPGSGAALAPLAVALAGAYRVVTIDLPGHGGSTGTVDDHDPVGQAADAVDAVRQALDLDAAPVAGVGYGAHVAARLRRPASLVLLAATAGRPARLPDPAPHGVGPLLDTWWRIRRAAVTGGWPTSGGDLPDAADLHEAVVDVLGQPATTGPARVAAEDLDRAAGLPLPSWSAQAIRAALTAHRVPGRHRRAGATALADTLGPVAYRTVLDAPLHIRAAGGDRPGRPVVVLPPAPGSSTSVAHLVEAFGRHRPAFGVDYPGHGRSAPLTCADPRPAASPTLPDARAAAPTLPEYLTRLDALVAGLGLDEVDVFGCHSGALLALLWQRRHPRRVRGLVLDGLPLGADFAHLDLDRYLPTLEPDVDGHHLLRAWAMAEDRTLWSPWYARTAAAHVPRPADPHRQWAWTVDLLRGAASYRHLYRAVLRHAVEAEPPGPVTPTLLLRTPGDPLSHDLARVRALLPHATVADGAGHADPTAAATTADAVTRFLDRVDDPARAVRPPATLLPGPGAGEPTLGSLP
ncbi:MULTISPECIES: alpha/beta hydrolase [Micromonospora]|uniref:Pimeloyl-ACP methyl ester carboxylesterase n=1 Tax=Micromonospora yangpuensis TaxID=683228 RepID=A0A1C6UVQ7_9ACTN|nr:alpha/beta fold hydrolase [Micromonospora yangpuensis]GGM25803.1 hypothetical protein GCM10012279_50380 [Micromonospora yangpuensis]SCL58135.1 Pimeloyl-ACP methyl ester carboxylesterase [Micromonospora yangpuensis]